MSNQIIDLYKGIEWHATHNAIPLVHRYVQDLANHISSNYHNVCNLLGNNGD
jgi:hypothetical protein